MSNIITELRQWDHELAGDRSGTLAAQAADIIERQQKALEMIVALKDGYKGSDAGRVSGYRVAGEIAERGLA